jgi:hypothetical protein
LIGTYSCGATAGTSTGLFSLGTYDAATSFAFNGYIDDFRLYNFAAPNVVPPYVYLPLDGTLVDAMGNVSVANLTAIGSPGYVPGVVGNNAISLANPAGGTAVQYIRGSWTYLNNFTVSGWVNFKETASPGYQIIYSSHNTIILFYVNPSNQIVVQLPSGTGSGFTLITTTFPIITNTWYYLTMIFQINGLCSFYVNNSLIDSFTNSGGYGTVTSSGLFSIGTYDTTTTFAFSGYVDDFKIYNYAVSVSPIAPMNWSHTAVSATGQYMMAAATSGGVFCSSNYGATWSQLTATQIPALVAPGGAARTLMGPLIQPNTTAATSANWSVNGVSWVASSSTNNNSANFAAWVAFNTLATSSTTPYSWASNAVYTVGAYTGSVSTSIVGQTAQLGEWIQIQTSIPLVLYSYSYGCGAFTGIPKTHFIVGSNDGSTWYPIQSAVMSNNPLVTSFTACTSYLIVNQSGSQTINGVSPNTGTGTFTTYPPYTTTSYLFFRFIVLSTFGAGNAEFTELFLNFSTPMPLLTAPATPPSNNTSAVTVTPNMTNLTAPTDTTVWTTPNGVMWKATATSTYIGNNPTNYAGLAFNGIVNLSWASGSSTVNKYNSSGVGMTTNTYMGAVYTTSGTIEIKGEALQLQSSVPLVMTSYSYACSSYVYAPKTYYLLGSNDGITWYNLHYASTPSNPFGTTNNIALASYIIVNFTGTQALSSIGAPSTTTTTTATQYSSNAYTYFRFIATDVYSNSLFELGEWYPNFTAYTPNPVNALAISNGGQNMLVAATGTTAPNSSGLAANTWTANGVNWTASASTFLGTGYNPYMMFDYTMGNTSTIPYSRWVPSSNTYRDFTPGNTSGITMTIQGIGSVQGDWAQLQSSVPLVMHSYQLATGFLATRLPKTYHIVGSNDGTTWFPIQSVVGGAVTSTGIYTIVPGVILINYTGAQVFGSSTITTTTYSTTTNAYIYFRLVCLSSYSSTVEYIDIGEWFINFQSGATYLSSNYGSTWSTAATAPTTAPLLATSGNGQYTVTGSGQLATVYSDTALVTYTIPTLTGINANINCASVSSTGQYMIILTQGTTNNVFYSTNFGITFTGMTVGTLPMTSCAMSYDGFEITVSNASTVYTLNRNTQGYSITMGNQSGVSNQGYNSIAIGNLAGVLNQSANSIVLNASGSIVDAYNPGFFVSPVQSQLTANHSSVALLGYGADNQIVQTGLSILSNGTINNSITTTGSISSNNSVSATGQMFLLSGNPPTNGVIRFTTAFGENYIQSGLEVSSGSKAPLIFGSIYAGNEWMRITTNGNVGIGMNNPTSRLHVGTGLTTNLGSALQTKWTDMGLSVNSTFTTGYNSSSVVLSGGVVTYTLAGLDSNGTLGVSGFTIIPGATYLFSWNVKSSVASAGIYFYANSNANPSYFGVTSTYATYTLQFTAASDPNFYFRPYVGANQSISFNAISITRLDTYMAGYLGIGNFSPGYQLTVSTDSATKPSTNTWTITSDERIKENIVLADVDRCLEIVRAVPLKHYRWKEDVYTKDQIKDRSKLGWIAQDVEKVFPKAVGTYRLAYNQVYDDVEKEDGTKEKKLVSEDVIEDCRDLNADQLYAVMYGTIQKLITENDSKTSQITAQSEKITLLESQLSELLSRLAALEAK